MGKVTAHRKMLVAPHAGAWIETCFVGKWRIALRVAPHAGAWIETRLRYQGYMAGTRQDLRPPATAASLAEAAATATTPIAVERVWGLIQGNIVTAEERAMMGRLL